MNYDNNYTPLPTYAQSPWLHHHGSTAIFSPPADAIGGRQVTPFIQARPLEHDMNQQDTGGATASLSSSSARSPKQQKKSSRACDYCRKKKVRCDIDDHTTVRVGNRCSSCTALNIACTFERIPLQRGPARGYKHKATEKKLKLDLESRTTGSSLASDSPRPELSAISSSMTAASRLEGSVRSTPITSPRIMSPISTRYRVPDIHFLPKIVQQHVPSMPSVGPEWIPQAIDKWYLLYQHTLPMLEADSVEFHQLLQRVHPLLRAALLFSIYAIVFKSRTAEKLDAVLAEQALTRYCSERREVGPHAILDRLIYLQVTMMLIVEADQRGYSVASHRAGHAVSSWLGISVGQAYSLRLHDIDNEADLHHSGHFSLGQRLWFILIVLDRWHSVSTSSPPFIADSNVRLDVEMPLVTMSTIYNHLYRLSVIVGHVYAYVLAPQMGSGYSTPHISGDFASRMLKTELEEWREKVDVIWGQSNLLHIAYWHVEILSILGATTAGLGMHDVVQLRNLASRLSSTLPNSATPVTPLNHHFYALCLCVQCHLLEFAETREDAIRGLRELREAVSRHAELVAEDDQCWDVTFLSVIDKKLLQPTIGVGEILLRRVRKRGYLLAISSILEDD